MNVDAMHGGDDGEGDEREEEFDWLWDDEDGDGSEVVEIHHPEEPEGQPEGRDGGVLWMRRTPRYRHRPCKHQTRGQVDGEDWHFVGDERH